MTHNGAVALFYHCAPLCVFYIPVKCAQLDIAAKYKMVMEELQFLPVTIDG